MFGSIRRTIFNWKMPADRGKSLTGMSAFELDSRSEQPLTLAFGEILNTASSFNMDFRLYLNLFILLFYFLKVMARILVSGGAGFIGSHLVDELLKNKKDEIVIFDNFHRGRKENIMNALKNGNVKLIEGDIRSLKDIRKIGAIDFVYHLAAQSNVAGAEENLDYTIGSNIEGTYNLLKFAVRNKVKGFLFASSREVYGDARKIPVDEGHPLNPVNFYGTTKLSGELLCKAFQNKYGLNVTIVRLANVYGPRDFGRVIPLFVKGIKERKNLTVFGGKQVLDFIWIGDVIDCIIRVCKKRKFYGETINIGTGRGVSIEMLAKMVVRLSGSKSKVVRKSPRKMDVKCFISKSDKLHFNALKLEKGLKMLL